MESYNPELTMVTRKLPDNFKHQTPRLEIRFYQAIDFPKWVTLFSDMKPKQNQWDWEPEEREDLTLARFKRKLERHKQEREIGDLYYFCVEHTTSNGLIGIGLISREKKEIGFQISNMFWGKGYGTEVCNGLIQIARELGMSPVRAEANPDNKASVQIIRKLHFRQMRVLSNGRIEFEINM